MPDVIEASMNGIMKRNFGYLDGKVEYELSCDNIVS